MACLPHWTLKYLGQKEVKGMLSPSSPVTNTVPGTWETLNKCLMKKSISKGVKDCVREIHLLFIHRIILTASQNKCSVL